MATLRWLGVGWGVSKTFAPLVRPKKNRAGIFFLVDGVFFEVTVFILKSMFWRAAQDSAKMRAGALARALRQRGFFRGFVQPSRTSTSE